MTTTTQERHLYPIDRMHVAPGQVIRNVDGDPSTVLSAQWEGEPEHALTVVLAPSDGSPTRTVWLSRSRSRLFTWLTPEQADQPGHDSTTGRCATCDSGYCKEACWNPWAADRA